MRQAPENSGACFLVSTACAVATLCGTVWLQSQLWKVLKMSAMKALAFDFDSEAIEAGWTVVVSGEAVSRTFANGQLAAIWRYSDAAGDWFKLFASDDTGDFPTLRAAMVIAAALENGGKL